MKTYLHLIDTNTPSPRDDVTPVFADYEAFSAMVDDLLNPFNDVTFDCIVGIDALGFILGAAIALRAGVSFVPIRKGGKLPVAVDSVEFVDYSGQPKSLELRAGAIKPETRVLLVDEWIETGAQMRAAVELVERQGGIVAGIAAINIDDTEGSRWLVENYRCFSLWSAGA